MSIGGKQSLGGYDNPTKIVLVEPWKYAKPAMTISFEQVLAQFYSIRHPLLFLIM